MDTDSAFEQLSPLKLALNTLISVNELIRRSAINCLQQIILGTDTGAQLSMVIDNPMWSAADYLLVN